jgi:hypothetical protein
VRDCRRTSTLPSRTFIAFVSALVERMRTVTPAAVA